MMYGYYPLFLFLLTALGGSIPLWSKGWTAQRMKYLLAFSGAFLLGITLIHLVPESLNHLGNTAGVLVLAGFFLQQAIQRFTHGLEHGHAHIDHTPHAPLTVWPLLLGLAIHAFSEGLPLGLRYDDPMLLPSLFLAIGLHKLPEAMLVTSLYYHQTRSRSRSLTVLFFFSCITPLTGLAAYFLGTRLSSVSTVVSWSIPVIAGVFIHIATTIFFESGTKAHEMNLKKWIIILAGVGLALLTFRMQGTHSHV